MTNEEIEEMNHLIAISADSEVHLPQVDQERLNYLLLKQKLDVETRRGV